MIRGIEKRNIFRNDRDRNDLLDRLASLLPETKTICYAWAFIPNHAHFLLRSGPSGIAVGNNQLALISGNRYARNIDKKMNLTYL